MSKKLNTDQIANELAESAFFKKRPDDQAPAPEPEPAAEPTPAPAVSPGSRTAPARPPARRQARRPAHEHESLQASKHASTLALPLEDLIGEIRKLVRNPGRETLYIRLTHQEKLDLADIVYAFKRDGRKTSENEIGRIAVAFLVADYEENGAESMLARVIEALHA